MLFPMSYVVKITCEPTGTALNGSSTRQAETPCLPRSPPLAPVAPRKVVSRGRRAPSVAVAILLVAVHSSVLPNLFCVELGAEHVVVHQVTSEREAYVPSCYKIRNPIQVCFVQFVAAFVGHRCGAACVGCRRLTSSQWQEISVDQ